MASLCATPGTAHAQAPSSDGDGLKRAREQFAQALALQTGGDWAGALALLKEVAAVKPTPQVRFNIALCEERLGLLVAALGDYELAGSDAQAQKADQVRQEVDARLESLKARVPRVVVKRGAGADAATISLDGVSLGDSVLNSPLPVDPGPHVVEGAGTGFLPFKQAFRVAEQQTATIEVKLELLPGKTEPTVTPPAPPSQTMRTAGFIVGGAGIASLIASGAMFYLPPHDDQRSRRAMWSRSPELPGQRAEHHRPRQAVHDARQRDPSRGRTRSRGRSNAGRAGRALEYPSKRRHRARSRGRERRWCDLGREVLSALARTLRIPAR